MSLSQFKNNFGGGARSNLFRAKIDFPAERAGKISNVAFVQALQKVPFMAKTAKLPASTITQIDVSYRGRKLKVAGERTFEEDYTLTFYNDRSFDLRNSFEAWMNSINSHTTNYSAYDASTSTNGLGNAGSLGYMGTIEIEQLDKRAGTVDLVSQPRIAGYKFIDAWPKSVGEIELSYDDDTIETFDVAFAYQYWERTGDIVTTD